MLVTMHTCYNGALTDSRIFANEYNSAVSNLSFPIFAKTSSFKFIFLVGLIVTVFICLGWLEILCGPLYGSY